MVDNYDGHQSSAGSQRRLQSTLGPNSTNTRSRPEFQVVSGVNSKRWENRTNSQRVSRQDEGYDGYQHRSLPRQRQEEVPPPPKEYDRYGKDHLSYNNSGGSRSGPSYETQLASRNHNLSGEVPNSNVYRTTARKEQTHLPFDNGDSSWSSQNNPGRLPVEERKTYERLPERQGGKGYSQSPNQQERDQTWEKYSEPTKPPRHEKQSGSRKHKNKYQSSSDGRNSYNKGSRKSDPEVRVGSMTSSWKDSYSTMQSVPVPGRQQRKSKASAVSQRRSSSASNSRDRVQRDAKGVMGERKPLKAPTSNPYASKRTKSFIDIKIPPIFIKALTDMDFMQPTQIQAHALPLILDNRRPSVMGHAKAGSGKTAAFGIGMLYWSSTQNDRCEALAICPTRELAIQVHEVVVSLAKFTQHGVFLAVPGCDNRSRITDAVVIGTPGKIYYDILGGEEMGRKVESSPRYPKRPLIEAEHVRILVIDEADHLLTKQGNLSDIVMRCRQMLPHDAQVLCFSATFDSEAREFVNVVAPGATLVEVQPSKQEQQAGKRLPGGINSLKIKHIMAKCNGEEQKYECLSDMFGYFNIGQSLIFVQTRDNANNLSRQLSEEGYQVGIIHGKMPKQLRDAVMEDFRAGKSTHLISSNLLARGIDIPNISVVINYDVPIGKHVDQYGRTSWGPDVDIYVHRAGRAGRFGRNGACITLIHDQPSYEKFSIITNRLAIDYGLKLKEVDAESLETIEEEVNSHLAS